MISWSFSSHHIEKRLNADYAFPVKSKGKVFKFIDIKTCSYVHVILQLNGRNQFPTRNTKLVNSAVYVESAGSEYVCFPNQAVFRFDN